MWELEVGSISLKPAASMVLEAVSLVLEAVPLVLEAVSLVLGEVLLPRGEWSASAMVQLWALLVRSH